MSFLANFNVLNLLQFKLLTKQNWYFDDMSQPENEIILYPQFKYI